MFSVLACAYVAVALPTSLPPSVGGSAQVAQKPQAAQLSTGQWEYLVMSFGKTYFSEPTGAKDSGDSKVLIYSPFGVNLGSEAVGTQKQMDTLGRFGWDLVGIVGSIGGDQQMVFKRVYDPARSLREAEQIASEAKALAEARAKKAKPAAGNEIAPPVNLDEQDADKREAEFKETMLAKLKTAAEAVMKDRTGEQLVQAEGTASFTRAQYGEKLASGEVRFEVIVDATESLLKEGSYRGSKAREAATQRAESIARVAGIGDGLPDRRATISISVTVVGQHQGKRFPLGSGYVFKWVPLP